MKDNSIPDVLCPNEHQSEEHGAKECANEVANMEDAEKQGHHDADYNLRLTLSEWRDGQLTETKFLEHRGKQNSMDASKQVFAQFVGIVGDVLQPHRMDE